MKLSEELRRILKSIDRRSYPAYKELAGSYSFGNYILSVDHVQGDPFAAPSKVRVTVNGKTAGFPQVCYDSKCKRVAMQDYLTRVFSSKIEKFNFKARGSGKSGLISVSRCGQEILERTACSIDPSSGEVTVRLEIGFPANGRTVCSGELEKILFDFLPECVRMSLFYRSLDEKAVTGVLNLAEDQQFIRDSLVSMGLTAFIANGSVLPRQSGVSDKPMSGSIPFVSPESYEVEIELPHRGKIKGMGVKKGIVLIVGGGYHGKSTVLKALELGVYNHIAGDGREYVITDDSAVKIRAEDGRSVKNTDISMFISNLPNGKDTGSFYTEDASGSTSQAANVVEAIESGSRVLLIDEDTSATNFMVRDELMQRVVHRNQEPIIPFIERAKYLYEAYGVSVILVAGSSGAYFQIADCIIQMDRYVPRDITEFAKTEAKNFPEVSCPKEEPEKLGFMRVPKAAQGRRDDGRLKIKTMGKEAVVINRETVDLRLVEQIADSEQVTALGYMTAYAQSRLFNGKDSVRDIVDKIFDLVERKGFQAVAPGSYLASGYAMPRRQELFFCLNRDRELRI